MGLLAHGSTGLPTGQTGSPSRIVHSLERAEESETNSTEIADYSEVHYTTTISRAIKEVEEKN